MNRKLVFVDKIVTVNERNEVLKNHAVIIEDGKIKELIPRKNVDPSKFTGDIHDFSGYTLIPGFVQTHIHLCQTLFRGFADDMELLEWLQNKIFRYENGHTKESLRASAQLGLLDLLSGGTTTILDMGTLRHQEIIFEELIKSGMHAVAGNCMMDINNLDDSFKESTDWNIKTSHELAGTYHNSNSGKIKYAFAPRFVLSCSEKLLKETKSMMQDFEGSILHTHSSENKKEIETVRKITGKENIEYFDAIGVLDSDTVLAHCIHLNEREINILKEKSVRVSHCPSSNLKLGSGIANIPGLMNEGISVSIGADGAPCNNSLSAFTEMRHAALIQKPIHGPTAMNALTVFRLATIEGAKALHLENEVGSIEVGKDADFVILNLEKHDQPLQLDDEQIYSGIVYSASKENVISVFVGGDLVIDKGNCLLFDEAELILKGKEELTKLIRRL